MDLEEIKDSLENGFEAKYYEEYDIFYLTSEKFVDSEKTFSETVPFGNLIIDFDDEGNIGGIELLDASKCIDVESLVIDTDSNKVESIERK